MKKIAIFIFLQSVLLLVHINAQEVEVIGKVLNQKNEPIEYANVQLLNADSVFIKGTSSDPNGKIKLSIFPSKSYRIKVSAIGYDPVNIYLKETDEKLKLGDIILMESSMALDEVTVTGSNTIHRIDRQIVFPSAFQQKSSNNALELLNNISLPRVLVNPMEKKISLMGDKELLLKINGVNATENEISAIPSNDIIRIEYYDTPGVRYNGSYVLDFIVKRRNSGGYLYTDLMNSPLVGFGNDLLSAKFNHRNSEWTMGYFFSFRDYKKSKTDETTIFNFPDKSIEKRSDGVFSPFNYQLHNIELNYNYTITDKRVVNVSFTTLINDNHNFSKSINYYSNVPNQIFTNLIESKNNNQNPVLDIYYKENLSSTQNLKVNIVGGIIKTKYIRDYDEKDVSDYSISKIWSQADGKKYSLIGELIHEKDWTNMALYSGINYKIGYAENNYQGAVSESTSLRNEDLYFYSQIQGKIRNLSYGLGFGVSYSYFDDTRSSYRFWTFRPSLSISINLAKDLNLQYSFNIKPSIPSLSQLSDVEQIIDQYQLYRGNPGLKPYRIYENELNANYQRKRMQYTLEITHTYSAKAIMSDIFYDESQSMFVRTNSNQLYFQSTNIGTVIRCNIIKEMLDLTLTGQISWMDSKGVNYHYKYNSYYGRINLNFNYKKWIAQMGVGSRYNQLWGQTVNYGDWWSMLQVGYKYKKLYVGLTAFNFLTNTYSNGYTNKSKILPTTSWSYIDDSAPIFCLNLSWNFSWGKKSNAENKALRNKDSDSGILKVN